MKFESYLNGTFEQVLTHLDHNTEGKTASLTTEESINFAHNYRISVRAYERYSIVGNNRVSAVCTLIETDDKPYIIITTTGGSQAMFFKFNTFGEESFMEVFTNKILAPYL